LDLGPREKFYQPLVGDRPNKCHQGDGRHPPTGNIAIPTSGGEPAQGPTGQVANQNPNPSSFPVGGGGNGGSAHFIFANLNGTISAWDTGATAFIQVTTPGANYSGLAINQAQT
jgi:hypothetical protein